MIRFTLSSDFTLQELAPFQEILKVAGLHRACPSATLDKSIQFFGIMIEGVYQL